MNNILLRTGLSFMGKNIFSHYHKLKKLEYASLQNNLSIQKKKLEKILIHSSRFVPYYENLLDEAGVVREGKVFLDKFSDIPILTKDLIRKNFDSLKSIDIQLNKRKPFLNTSGGSTGVPVAFIQDRDYWTRSMAGAWLQNSFVAPFPSRHIKLWGSERDIIKNGDGINASLKNILYRRKVLNAFRMTENDMLNYLNEITRYQPVLIEAYAQSAYELASYINSNKLRVFSPKGIITSAGTLYPEMKELIKNSFGCPVLNRYGSREVGPIACSCKNDLGLHLNILQNHVEILDDNLESCGPGMLGEAYITTLDNFSMPLIRYKIGDMAVPESNDVQCACGRGMPLIRKVIGRTVNVFKTRCGTKIDGEYYTHLFYFKPWVKKFQVIQREYELIEIFIEVEGAENKKDIKEIENKIKLVMGAECRVEFNIVEEIETPKSGKFLYTISEVVG